MSFCSDYVSVSVCSESLSNDLDKSIAKDSLHVLNNSAHVLRVQDIGKQVKKVLPGFDIFKNIDRRFTEEIYILSDFVSQNGECAGCKTRVFCDTKCQICGTTYFCTQECHERFSEEHKKTCNSYDLFVFPSPSVERFTLTASNGESHSFDIRTDPYLTMLYFRSWVCLEDIEVKNIDIDMKITDEMMIYLLKKEERKLRNRQIAEAIKEREEWERTRPDRERMEKERCQQFELEYEQRTKELLLEKQKRSQKAKNRQSGRYIRI